MAKSTDSKPDLTVKPEIMLLERLLNDINAGVLRVPRFQRSFVWRPEQMLDLFDSIDRGYPIGSLLVWETDAPIPSIDKIGGMRLPAPAGKRTSYILDGHQRLSTLYGSLMRPNSFRRDLDQQSWMWWIYYDLTAPERERRFRHWKRDEEPPRSYLPVRSMLRTMDFLAFARKLYELGWAEDRVTQLIEDAESVTQRIKSHTVTIIRLVGGDLTQAVEVFSRTNSTGQVMSPAQMVSALTYHEGAEETLSEQIDAIVDKLTDTGYGNLSTDSIFRAVLAVAGEYDIRIDAWDRLARRVEGRLAAAVPATETALGLAIEFLRSEVRVPLARLVPYNIQIVLLTLFFHVQPEPSARQRRTLRKWFWSTSWSGYFAGANTTQVKDSLERMRSFAQGGAEPYGTSERARPFPDRFDLRSARVRILLLWELMEFPRRLDVDGHGFDVVSMLERLDSKAYRPIVKGPSPANRVVLVTPPRTSVRQALIALPPAVAGLVLDSHGIPTHAYNKLVGGDASGFVAARAEFLAARERAFMKRLDIEPPETALGETDIDTE
jgi:hypothetical protein